MCVHVITSSWCLLLSPPYLGVRSRVLHLILVSGLVSPPYLGVWVCVLHLILVPGLVCFHLILVFGFVCYTLSWCRVLCVSTLSWCLGLCATPYLGAGSCVSPPYLGAWVCVLHLILVLSSLSYTVLVLFGQTLFFSAPDSTSSFGLVFLLSLSIGGSSSDVVLSVSLCICVCVHPQMLSRVCLSVYVCVCVHPQMLSVSVFLCMYVCVHPQMLSSCFPPLWARQSNLLLSSAPVGVSLRWVGLSCPERGYVSPPHTPSGVFVASFSMLHLQ